MRNLVVRLVVLPGFLKPGLGTVDILFISKADGNVQHQLRAREVSALTVYHVLPPPPWAPEWEPRLTESNPANGMLVCGVSLCHCPPCDCLSTFSCSCGPMHSPCTCLPIRPYCSFFCTTVCHNSAHAHSCSSQAPFLFYNHDICCYARQEVHKKISFSLRAVRDSRSSAH